MPSAKVAWRHKESNSRVEIVPNPFGGVNTHLWRNEAYLIGIVPVVRPAYSLQTENGKGTGEKKPAHWLHCFELEYGVLARQKILNHETEDGDMFLTEEARCDADRVGVADDR